MKEIKTKADLFITLIAGSITGTVLGLGIAFLINWLMP
jgi:uncharacterized membrane protein YgaE (UPF0421/DUF939 family)